MILCTSQMAMANDNVYDGMVGIEDSGDDSQVPEADWVVIDEVGSGDDEPDTRTVQFVEPEPSTSSKKREKPCPACPVRSSVVFRHAHSMSSQGHLPMDLINHKIPVEDRVDLFRVFILTLLHFIGKTTLEAASEWAKERSWLVD